MTTRTSQDDMGGNATQLHDKMIETANDLIRQSRDTIHESRETLRLSRELIAHRRKGLFAR